MKINKIAITNFKVFRKLVLDFESPDLIIFDGPNGFGKTSIYDAIELVFTGHIRRYATLGTLIVDGRESFEEHPFYHEGANGDIIITIQFIKDGETFILERVAKREAIRSGIDFSIYQLYIKSQFDDIAGQPVADEKEFLTRIMGMNYKENFQFLNYVEQEDSLYLLKNQDRNRKELIAHLFNVSDFEHKISLISRLKQKIDILCNNDEKITIQDLERQIKQVSDFVAQSYESADYIQLFPLREIPWDVENYDFRSTSYDSLFGQDGILPRIQNLVTERDAFRSFYQNETINLITGNSALLGEFLKYYHFIPSKSEMMQQRNVYLATKSLQRALEDFSAEDLKNGRLPSMDAAPAYITEVLKEQYNERLKALQEALGEVDKLGTIYNMILESREKLVRNIVALKNEDATVQGACFLCGYDWPDIEKQLENIAVQSEEIKKLISGKAELFSASFIAFKEHTVKPILGIIDKELTENTVNVDFINKLAAYDETTFVSLVKNFERIAFPFKDYLNTTVNLLAELKGAEVNERLIGMITEVDYQKIGQYFREDFNFYFYDDFDALLAFDVTVISKKAGYLRYLYSLQQNEFLSRLNQELEEKQRKFTGASDLSDQLKKLKKIYEESLKSYQKKVIRDIEIIFHIYSGRIMQNFHGGLGLFISDKNGIRFQTNPNKTFDALFSMSSGQLSALIISFTLALHKKYSKNSLILIDDPVQTMDELNVVGFIELLRNEFADNQIILSTHEDLMSIFIRYKFESYSLQHSRVNLKESEYLA